MKVSSETEAVRAKASVVVLEALEEFEGFSFPLGSTLYDFVDTDALDALFDSDREANTTIQLDIQEVTVTVRESADKISVRVTDEEE
ncbi:HalOD1 output domain-containing protein [Halorussus halophilus]|uniref:HalOD1 output domain-containing protein n=1 Tax=Halorussus halophilus TaxID=2650975 RepID=UPI001301727C|nr:HalOD1 output domain-containing protein [Halorussus halophilus]